MLDQSFSSENFKKIIGIENRKGVCLEKIFFRNTVYKTIEKIKKCNSDIQEKRAEKDADELKKLNETRKALQEEKETLLTSELQKVSQNILKPSFQIEIEKIERNGRKPHYQIKDGPENYFAVKQIQSNIAHLFKVKQASKFEIITQVKGLLRDEFPKYILKTDLDDFYESIPHKELWEKINDNNLLAPFSRKLLRQIFQQYKALSGSTKGVPRGIGVSPYLVELYMRSVDEAIRGLAGVYYYARYVDDIVIFFSPQSSKHLEKVKNKIEGFGLTLNPLKTKEINLTSGTMEFQGLEYLGYEISVKEEGPFFSFTSRKYDKYRKRIAATFYHYNCSRQTNEKEAREILVKRIRFMTGNTRLKNVKSSVLIGIYYSNHLLDDKEALRKLDAYLIEKIRRNIKSSRLKRRLEKYSYLSGFDSRRFSDFQINELEQIIKIWK